MSSLDQLISRVVDSVYPSTKQLEKRLSSGKKLRIYNGIDPTSPHIHIGNAIPLRLLRGFQEQGHKIILLIGDFTGMIGDPSGRDAQRKPLSRKQIEENSSTYTEQAKKILDFEKNPPEITYNSKWWGKTNLSEFFEILSRYTVSQLIERNMFQERIKKGLPIATSEFLYPTLQGYDSVALNVDIEIGATDQTFNMLIGREMVKTYKNKEKIVITTPIIEGADGRKMSKSFGNTIDINSNPNDMFGKLMSIKDTLIVKYLNLATTLDQKEIDEISSRLKSASINPMETKKRLAYEVVSLYNGREAAETAKQEFERVFQRGERISEVKVINKPRSILPISYASLATVSEATPSVSAAIRLAENKGLRFDGEIITQPRHLLNEDGVQGNETIIDVGKRKSVKIIWR